jgi:hypothetical protein
MLFNPKAEDRLGRLAERLQQMPALTRELFSEVIAEACPRTIVLGKAGKTARLERVAEAGAWTDAALALVALELPAWSIRRLACEDGEWFSALSKHPNLPRELDDSVEARHETLPLAILCTLVAARQQTAAQAAPVPMVPRVRPLAGEALCCDSVA